MSSATLKARIKLASHHPNSSLTAEEIIAKALEHKVYVAWSGGRCSTMALFLTLKQDDDIPVMFNNTGVEYPETVEYVHEIAEEWSLNFHEVKPKTDFFAVAKEHGFPQLRGSGGAGRPRKPMCCKLLKEDPANEFRRERGFDGYITGLRVEENRPRALAIYQKGPFYLASRDRVWRFHPVALWPLEQLNQCAAENHVRLNPLYDRGLHRIGCWPCTGFLSWREALKKVNPRWYKVLNRMYQKSVGEPTLWEYTDFYDLCLEETR